MPNRSRRSILAGNMSERFSARGVAACCLLFAALTGCGKSGSSSPGATAGGNGMPGGAGADTSGFPDAGGISVGPVDGSVNTKLPPLPGLNHVSAKLNDDSAEVTFDPVDGALDYRVYPLPADDDITVKDGGEIVVKNGTYRCGGDRETAPTIVDDAEYIGGGAIHAIAVGMVGNFARTLDGAVLGYVYTDPGPDRMPVYALGESNVNADVNCFWARWDASRSKKYTTSKDEHDMLVAAGARDDGIAFYVPSAASADTTQVYVGEDQLGTPYQQRWYFSDGPEADARTTKAPAFFALKAAADKTQALLRVFYLNSCGMSHDELAVGKERFNRIYHQWDKLPWWSVLWTGIKEPTTLVVEALDAGCPYQGFFAPMTLASLTATYGDQSIIHEPYMTIDDIRAASPSGQVFMNGQHGPAWIWDSKKLTNGMQPAAPAPAPLPKPVARSFVKVQPNPHPQMDFFAGFDGPAEDFVTAPCEGNACPFIERRQSPTFDQSFIYNEFDATRKLISYGQLMGEWWVAYADQSADTNGKYRLTANKKANMDGASYLHATMEVDTVSTARRYPQILISDRDAPIQDTLEQGHTLIVQPRGSTSSNFDWPIEYQIEVCKLRTWDVNNQCPTYDLRNLPQSGNSPARLAPNVELGEHASADHRAKFDVYASTARVYVFIDDKPYGCANMPAGALPNGPVTVTWGDVLYHSGVDQVFRFHTAHLQVDTRRHFDNLGFSSGVAAPGWDENILPCVAPISL